MHSIAAILALAFFLPQTPDPTLPPATAHAQYTVVGEGVQVYRCTATIATATTPTTFKWVFQEPRATLFDTTTKLPIGKHSAGPTWTWNDASSITGKLLAKEPSPDPNAIPWLLLETHSTGATGALTNIKFVRRSDTQAGAAPATGCDARTLNNTISVPYEATYTFYTAN
jgi:hypothetical protein